MSDSNSRLSILQQLLPRAVTGDEVALVDSAESCAQFLNERLQSTKLLHKGRRRPGVIQPFVTDEVERFDELAGRFLGVPTEPAWKVDVPGISVPP